MFDRDKPAIYPGKGGNVAGGGDRKQEVEGSMRSGKEGGEPAAEKQARKARQGKAAVGEGSCRAPSSNNLCSRAFPPLHGLPTS